MNKLLINGRSEPEVFDQEIDWMYDQDPELCYWSAFWLFFIFLLCLLAGCNKEAFAYTDQEAERCVIGEASNQGYTGMLAVSEVIRHNKSLEGLYGCQASHVASEPVWVWNVARKAYIASKNTNITRGANHFENVQAFGSPVWAAKCRITAKIKDQLFFKC